VACVPHLRRFGKGSAKVRGRYINRSKRRGCGPGLKPKIYGDFRLNEGVLSYGLLRPMLRSFQQIYAARGVIAPVAAILLVAAILFVFTLPVFDAGFDHVTFALPVVVFFLLAPAGVTFGWVSAEENFSPTEPFLAASFGRAPPA